MLYVTNKSLDNMGTGVQKKIELQIDCFNDFGLECRHYNLCFIKKPTVLNKILMRLPGINVHKHWSVSAFLDEKYLYIRSLGAWDKYSIEFFLKMKELNPKIKIVYEIPTYPYDDEMIKSWKEWPLFFKDKWNRRYINRFIDRIATLTDDKEIFGVRTLMIGNGINIEKIRPRKVRNTHDIHAIAVANFEWWHGYDRFIEGLKSYYATNPSRKVYFHMVGHGSEFERYKKMADKYDLGDYVILYDQQTGEGLDDIYDKCNLGIASLGCYRKGLNETQELKSREYVAKGLPFVASVRISDISDGDKESIYLQVSNDNSPIDIEEVINFYDRIYIEGADSVNTRLRKFAKDHFSMDAAMKAVIDYFKDGK